MRAPRRSDDVKLIKGKKSVFKEQEMITSEIALPKINVLGSTMAYREAGDHEAPVAVFLHGNPTSSYIKAQSTSTAESTSS
jgi:hypothetical protein